jgi:hypothetical protein
MEDVPIVCTLSEPDLQVRRRSLLNWIGQTAIEVTPTINGYTYRFAPEADVLARLANLVEMERLCCQFLTFKIVVQPQSPIALEITGPPGATELITDLFGSDRLRKMSE